MCTFRQEYWVFGQKLFATRFEGGDTRDIPLPKGVMLSKAPFMALEQARDVATQLAAVTSDFEVNEVELRVYKEEPVVANA